MANDLAHEHSPYLQQHAHNPVHWMPWGEAALAKAKAENKLLIVSIGYSACHWCHVMERESFENEAVAQTMNTFYVSVKIDREERPDIDQVYMLAVQLMTKSGGWPLNCICLPDGRPIYGGTYFKAQDWQNILLQIAQMWEENPQVALDYADKLTQGIHQAENLPLRPIPEQYNQQDLLQVVLPWKQQFDLREGGYLREPKFPLPNNWQFLLRYAVLADDAETLAQVHMTLEKMGRGGIYDQVGGGFARYSVDDKWHVPHFEKMLYDNAQLIALYSEAYQQQPNPLYKRIVEETVAWLHREMLADNGGFYAALDADSEGVEGKFYTFHTAEFEQLFGAQAERYASYFQMSQAGNWAEEETNILCCAMENSANELSAHELAAVKQTLLAYREQRVRPARDHKQLTAWNALTAQGLLDAYRSFDNADYLLSARKTLNFIVNNCFKEAFLLHQPEDKNRAIYAFLDDYAFTITALIALYEATFEEKWLLHADELTKKVIVLFYDRDKQTFYYTANNAPELISRKSEIMDNVIPSSSSAMVRALFKLATLFDNADYQAIADQVFANVYPHIQQYGSAYSNWSIALLEQVYGLQEIALLGEDAQKWRKELDKSYFPNKVTLGGIKSTLPLLRNKEDMKSKAYLCVHKTCSLPLTSVDQLLELLHNNRA